MHCLESNIQVADVVVQLVTKVAHLSCGCEILVTKALKQAVGKFDQIGRADSPDGIDSLRLHDSPLRLRGGQSYPPHVGCVSVKDVDIRVAHLLCKISSTLQIA